MRGIFENLGWKLLSLGLAVLLWFSVVGEPEVTTFKTAPVVFRGIASGLEIVSDPPATVRLEVRGPQSALEGADSSSIAVVLDLSSVHQPSIRTFTIDRRAVRLPSGVELIHPIPTQIRLRFEQRITRPVPVKVRFSGSPPEGYQISRAEADPKELRISGAESRVRQIDFVETDPIDLANVVGEKSFQAHVFAGDPGVQIDSAPVVTVKVAMEKVRPIQTPQTPR